jgi:4'-phosphopantetheinyl transferase EntD
LPVIIGLKEYTREVNQEADALIAMAARVRRLMQRDLAAFEARYPQLIQDIQILAEKIEDSKRQLEVQEKLSASHNSLVMKRNQDMTELKKLIFEAREATKKAIKTLSDEEKLNFQAEAEVGKRAKENLDLEGEIRRREHVEK